MLSAKLKKLRLEKNFTLLDVSRATGLSIETIRRAENGESLNERTAHRIAMFVKTRTGIGNPADRGDKPGRRSGR